MINLAKYMGYFALQSSVQKLPNRLRCRLGFGLGWAQGSIY